jgi:hypothetical protein
MSETALDFPHVAPSQKWNCVTHWVAHSNLQVGNLAKTEVGPELRGGRHSAFDLRFSR